MATFLPFYRTHSSNNAENRAPWTYGEPYLSIIRQLLQLRYRLLPYFYTLSWEASQKGYPLVRPLFWSANDDSTLWDVEDAFFLGDALLIYPIVEEGARSRNAILPKGRWYSFWDDVPLEGAGQVEIEAPLEQIPLLVRAGTILPMEEEHQFILHLYPVVQGSSESRVYSDAGDGYAEWRLDTFRMVRKDDGLDLTWESQGDFAFSYTGIQLHVHGIKLQQAWVDEREVTCQENRLDCTLFQKIRLRGEFL
jgi:alpha-glucosidase